MLRSWSRRSGFDNVRFAASTVLVVAMPIVAPLAWVGCSDDDSPFPSGNDNTPAPVDSGVVDSGPMADPAFARISCDDVTGSCMAFAEGEEADLLNAVNSLTDDMTIVLGAGTFSFDNAVTIRQADGITFTGQGIDETILDFADQPVQANGVDVVSDNFTISHLTITDAKKDALRIETSENVRIQFVKATWAAGPSTDNGAYGLYPVRCTNVLMEDSEAYNAADAGIYVGQSINVIVRRNIAARNVAGLEIENTQFADVYDNVVEDNTAGLVVFDLPGNPVIGRDVKIRNNIIRNNNRGNFAPIGSVVSQIPAGTGTFALASKRVEIASNTYEGNKTSDIALLSGLALDADPNNWAIAKDAVVGSTVGLTLVDAGPAYLNFPSNEIWVHDNMHTTTGTAPDGADATARPIGALLALTYLFTLPVDSVLYDGIGETVDPNTPANNTNNNRICISNEPTANWATLDLPNLQGIVAGGGQPTFADLYRPVQPFAPYNCTGFTTGPIPDVTLP